MTILQEKWLPVIDPELCNGCNACVEACGPACLQMVEDVAALTLPDRCGSEEHCIGPCPVGAIRMQWAPYRGDASVGRWRDSSTP